MNEASPTSPRKYYYPFQKLCFVSQGSSSSGVLLGATGPCICSFNAATGEYLSRWPQDGDPDSNGGGDEHDGDQDERPAKRRKVSMDKDTDDSDTSVEIVAQRLKGARRKPKVLNEKPPNVSHLFATGNGSHVIAITTDDKCIRVFKCSAKGHLKVQSKRCIPFVTA